MLLDIGRTVTGTLSLDELFRTIHQETARVLEASGFYISLYDPAEDLATVVFYADQGDDRHPDITYVGSQSEVIRTGQPCMLGNRASVDSLLVLGDEGRELTRSAISAPVRYKGQVIGAISAQSYEADSYETEDLELLQGIADVAAVAIENARYVSEIDQRRREAEQIEEIGRAVTGSLETRNVIRKVIEAAVEILEVDSSTVWLLEEGYTMQVAASGGKIQVPEGRSWELDTEFYDVLVRDREAVLLHDLARREQMPETLRDLLDGGSGMVVPLVVVDEVVGGLSVGSEEERTFTESDARVLSRLASQASVALENARLHADVQALSLTDPLTKLPNRRHLQVHLEREVAAARRGRPLTVVLFDLDDFKHLNDTLGHVAGDRILERIGQVLSDETRSMNLVARYGGDEFISVLSDSNVEAAGIRARRVAERVRTDPHLEPHGITVSFGVATFEEEMETHGDLIRAADRDLYRVKDQRVERQRPG